MSRFNLQLLRIISAMILKTGRRRLLATLLTAFVACALSWQFWIGRAQVKAWAQNTSRVTTVSAASYASIVSPEEIVAAFGLNLATVTKQAEDADPSAPGIQLPTLLGGVSVEVNSRSARLLLVSPNQINLVIPPDLESGTGSVVVRTEKGAIVASGDIEIRPAAPAVFTANSSGKGVPAGVILRVRANGAQSYEPLAQFDAATNSFVPRPIDLGPPGDGAKWGQINGGLLTLQVGALAVSGDTVLAGTRSGGVFVTTISQ